MNSLKLKSFFNNLILQINLFFVNLFLNCVFLDFEKKQLRIGKKSEKIYQVSDS